MLMSEKLSTEVLDADLEISYPSVSPEVFDFAEIMRDSGLEDRYLPEQMEELRKILEKHKKIFSNDLGRTDFAEHDIELITMKPFRIKPYQTSHRQNENLKQEVKRMLKFIEVAEFDFVSPLILVEVQGREPRPCTDYKKLNSLTRTEYFPHPNIEERVERVAAAKYNTSLDLTKGYW